LRLAVVSKRQPCARSMQTSEGRRANVISPWCRQWVAARPSWQDIKTGVQHALRVQSLAVPVALISLSLLALPCSFSTRLVGAKLIRAGQVAGREWVESLDDISWSREALLLARGEDSVLVFIVMRRFLLACTGVLLFGLVMLHFRGDSREHGRRALMWGVAYGFGLFVVTTGLAWASIEGWIELAPTFSQPFRNGCPAIVLLSTWSLALVKLFPKQQRRKAAGRTGLLLAEGFLVYVMWRLVSGIYFRMTDPIARICMASMMPHVLGLTTFDLFFRLGCANVERSELEAAAMFLAVPTSFSISMSAVLQLGSADLVSGICAEVGASFMEVYLKRCLLSGETFFQHCERYIRTCCFGSGSRIVVPQGIVPAPENFGNEEARAASVPSMSSADSAVSARRASSKEVTRDLLVLVAMYSNMMDIVVHAFATIFIIFSRVNLNESNALPMPNRQVFSLFMMKMAIEVCTDIYISVNVARLGRANSSMAEAWELISKEGRVALGFMSAFFAADILTYHMSKLCPYSADGLELLSIGLCA